jgi:ribosomal protein S18 acetylase RimI-like enzyme
MPPAPSVCAACAFVIQRLAPDDLVSVAHCIAIDADAFPYASSPFGQRDRAGRAWVARDDRCLPVLGFVAGRVRGPVLYVAGLAVDRTWRRRGVGRALLRACVEDACAEGLDAISLHVALGNGGAVGLYVAEGFAVRRVLRDFYPAGARNVDHDAYEMVRALP